MKTVPVSKMCLLAAAIGFSFLLTAPRTARAHCDSLDGPVVTEARAALAKADVTPLLKWVKEEQEAEVRDAFRKTLIVRGKGPEARELADLYFFETFVRLHRAAEGEPYTGLKPAGAEEEPAIAASDESLRTGSVERLARNVSEKAAAGIRARFARAIELKKHAGESVGAGRGYVHAYVEFIHYVERLHRAAGDAQAHGPEEKGHAGAGH